MSNDNEFWSNDVNNNIVIEPPFKNSLTILEVTEKAEKLCEEFKNPGWEGFYSKAIYWLGMDRIELIEARVSDSAYAGRLFTKILKQETDAAIKKLTAQARLKNMRGDNASS